MKFVQTITVNRNELKAVKEQIRVLANLINDKDMLKDLDRHVRITNRLKLTVGNIKTVFRLSDTYEMEQTIEIDEAYFVEACKLLSGFVQIFHIFAPMFKHLLPIVKDFAKFIEDGSKIEEIESTIESIKEPAPTEKPEKSGASMTLH